MYYIYLIALCNTISIQLNDENVYSNQEGWIQVSLYMVLWCYLHNSLIFYLVLEIQSSLQQTYTGIPKECEISQHINDAL